VTLTINLNEETAWAIGNFNHRSRWKGSHHVGISLNNGNRFGKDDIHDEGKARHGPNGVSSRSVEQPPWLSL